MNADAAIASEIEAAQPALLSHTEQRSLSIRLTLSLVAAGLLVISLTWSFVFPAQSEVGNLVAGLAAALVAAPALAAAWRSLRFPDLHGITDQLIALALIAAWATGDLVTATLLPLVMTIGHVLEERSLLGSHEAIRALTRLTRSKARRIVGRDAIEDVSADDLRTGDEVEIRAGDRVPADGLVRTGTSSVDTASITGESVPVDVKPGDQIFGGSINLDGHLVVTVTRVGSEATLGRVIALMQEAEQAKPPVTRLLERYAGRYLGFVLLLAATVWFMSGNAAAMLAVLVASCPCALVLAAPATSIAAIAVASRHGILVKGAAFLEQLATVDSVIFDKTGTVTLGQLRLVDVLRADGVDRRDLITLAGSLGAASSHPVSQAAAGQVPEPERLPARDVRETRGLGVTATIAGHGVAFGRKELFQDLKISAPPPPEHEGPIAGVARDGRFLGWLLFADEARPEARGAVAELKQLGLTRLVLLTGDRAAEARRIARQLDVPDVRAEALPAQKLQLVLSEIEAGRKPLVVGDGINDALALKAGAVGAAMGAQGTGVALASADIVLMTNDLRRLGTSIRLSRRCRQTIYANVAIGMGWTIVVVASAASGILGAGGALIAAVLHNIGTLVVMGNAGRLLKFHERLG